MTDKKVDPTLTVSTKEGRLAILDFATKMALAGKLKAGSMAGIVAAVESGRKELGEDDETKTDNHRRMLVLKAISDRIDERIDGIPALGLTDEMRVRIDAVLDENGFDRLKRLTSGEGPKRVFIDVVDPIGDEFKEELDLRDDATDGQRSFNEVRPWPDQSPVLDAEFSEEPAEEQP